jgi:hypothetical protein
MPYRFIKIQVQLTFENFTGFSPDHWQKSHLMRGASICAQDKTATSKSHYHRLGDRVHRMPVVVLRPDVLVDGQQGANSGKTKKNAPFATAPSRCNTSQELVALVPSESSTPNLLRG